MTTPAPDNLQGAKPAIVSFWDGVAARFKTVSLDDPMPVVVTSQSAPGGKTAVTIAAADVTGNPAFSIGAALPTGSNTIGNVNVQNSPSVNLLANNALVNESVTALGAGLSYTGTGRDTGVNPQFNRVRAFVLHQAGTGAQPGYLVLQQSADNVSFVEHSRIPIPSDNMFHTFEKVLSARYYRWVFINGATAQTSFSLQTTQVRSDGASLDTEKNLAFPIAIAVQAASATGTSPVFDMGANHNWDRARAYAASDAAGTLVVDQSTDNANWFQTPNTQSLAGSAAIAANASVASLHEVAIVARYVRFKIVNGATAQTVLRCGLALISS